MAATKSQDGASMKDSLANGEPITHFFYEHQGERSVEPLMLIDTGITLWHEHIYTNEVYDNSHLWELANRLLDARQDTPMYSWVEWLRYRITTGALVPSEWDSGKPYPYKGLLISAVYFQEAERLCLQGDPNRAWHVTAMAYYHLGLNTAASTRENAAKAAKMKHAAISEKMRVLVHGALDRIKRDGSANSIESAKDQVIELLRKNEKGLLKDWLNEFETLVPKATKGRTESKLKNDMFARIRNMLDNWCLPSGPYPDIAEAFSHFSRRKRKSKSSAIKDSPTSACIPIDESEYYLRLISILEDGRMLTVKVSDASEEEKT